MPDRTEQRRLAAILATDIVGYSRLMADDEEAMLRRLRSLRAELVDPAIKKFGGRIVKLMGDGSLVEFASVVDAIRCAIDIQQYMGKRNDGVVDDQHIHLRIGVNLGDVIVDGDDIYGDGVNIASRLEGLAEPGGIVVSGTVYDYAKGKVQARFTDMGPQDVKNIPEPVRAYSVRWDGAADKIPKGTSRPGKRSARVLVAGALVALLLVIVSGTSWFVRDTPPATGKPSIAVLPFANVGAGEDIDRLAGGLTEDVITDLSRFRDFDVIARNSTDIYKGKAVDIREVGRDLGVNYVVEGSIQRDAERIRVTAQLIDARDGTHLWSERWDRPAKDLFAVQTEIAEIVAARIASGNGISFSSEATATRRARPEDLSAYELFLRFRDVHHRNPPHSIYAGIELLKQAVKKDPEFARGWQALATAYDSLGGFEDDNEAIRKAALNAAERAVDVDPLDADSHAALAEILATYGLIERARSEYDIALRLNSGSIGIVLSAAAWSAYFGKAERGAELADRARWLDPNSPTTRYHRLASAYFFARRFEDSLEMAVKQAPEDRNRWGWIRLTATYAALGRDEKAKAAIAETRERYPNVTIQGFISGPDWNEDRHVVIEYMRKAGFPSCASNEERAAIEEPFPLPECEAEK